MASELKKLAIQVYDRHGHYTDEAVNELASLIEANGELRKSAVRRAAYDLIREIQREVRQEVIAEATGEKQVQPIKMNREEREAIRDRLRNRGIYAFPMLDGTPLRDASREQVLSDANFYRGQEVAAGANRRFLQAIASKLKQGEKVADVFSEAQLTRLRKKAERMTKVNAG